MMGLSLALFQSRSLEALNSVKRKARDLPGGGQKAGSDADPLFLLLRHLIEHNFVKRRQHFAEVAAKRTAQAATQQVRTVEKERAEVAELADIAGQELASG
jgi:hypothetical protein